MKWLINYIRSCFCNHDWEFLKEVRYFSDGYDRPEQITIIYRCKKCGMVQKIKC